MTGQPLTVRQAESFRKALTDFEAKKYDECLKDLDGLLAEVPGHSESQCLKGLVFHYLERDGAEDMIKEGLKSEHVNGMSWHVAGIYYKVKRQFTDAYKAYLRSYMMEKDNTLVQQDLSQLAMQERELAVVCDVRRRFLAQKPTTHYAWLGLAVAQYMNKAYQAAEGTLRLYNKVLFAPPTTKEEKKRRPLDISEVLLFKNMVIAGSGDYKRALMTLEEDSSQISDGLAVAELKAQYLCELGRVDDSLLEYNALIERNPNCASYYSAVERLLDIKDEAALAKFYRVYQAQFPKAEFPKLRPLEFLTGDELLTYLKKFLEEKIDRAVPSLFTLIQGLYETNPSIVTTAINSIEQPTEAPKLDSWLHLQAQHSSRIGNNDKALEQINKAIEISPATIEYVLTKCRILNAMGDFESAKSIASEAIKMDEGDRYLNTEAAFFALEAEDIDKCIEIASIIPLSGNNTVDGMKYMCDLEAVNFLSKLAIGCAAQAEHGMALKYGHSIINTFYQYYQDQYEFHYYGARRSTLRAYMQLVDWEDHLYEYPRYLDAVKLVINEYVILGQHLPDGVDAETRAQMKLHREDEAKKIQAREIPPPQDGVPPIEADKDPFGVEFEECADPLDAAWKVYSRASTELPGSYVLVQLAFKILLAQKKYILAVQHIKKAAALGASSSWIAAAAATARVALESDEAAPAVVKQLQLKVLPTIATEGDVLGSEVTEYIDNYVVDSTELWLEARLQCNRLEGVSEKLIQKLPEMCVFKARKIHSMLRCYGVEKQFADAVKSKWPAASFV